VRHLFLHPSSKGSMDKWLQQKKFMKHDDIIIIIMWGERIKTKQLNHRTLGNKDESDTIKRNNGNSSNIYRGSWRAEMKNLLLFTKITSVCDIILSNWSGWGSPSELLLSGLREYPFFSWFVREWAEIIHLASFVSF